MGVHVGTGRVAAALSVAVVVALLPTGSIAATSPGDTPTAPAASAPAGAARPQQSPDPRLTPHRESRFAPAEPPQRIAPRTLIESRLSRHDGKVRVSSAKGTHVWTASALAEHDVPAAALHAYKNASATMARQDPGCQIPWTLLAGIGRVESNHGRYGGSVLAADGVPHPGIFGVPLNGRGAVAAIPDTDNGRLDHDKVWDRAVGPMQFIPSTWLHSGRDGDGDGVDNPQDINDAALAAAAYLCSGSGSILPESAMKAAIFRYNPSDYYVALVMAFERGYRTGVFVIPSPPAPTAHHKHHHKAHHKARHHRHHAVRHEQPAVHHHTRRHRHHTSPSPAPTQSSSPKPTVKTSSTPSPSPKPSPSPSPSTPTLVSMTGSLATCAQGWCLDGAPLDLGPDSQLVAAAAEDYDADGTVETVIAELTGLAGQSVTVSVAKDTAPEKVYLIGGLGYRNADGSFAQPH
ncbi:MAG TPA: lytic murein transglycosylase [Nocardioidaceae bacterium]|nr:lytic murein transglycosylase [Nocardioidaceae bacterium]